MQSHIAIEEFSRDELNEGDFAWSDGHWWSNWEEAGIERCFVAMDFRDERIILVGFLTMDGNRECVAIEVHPEYQGQGIAKALVLKAWCFVPRENSCLGFWAKAQQWKEEEEE